MECFISKPKHAHIEPIIVLDSGDDDCNPDNGDHNSQQNCVEKQEREIQEHPQER